MTKNNAALGQIDLPEWDLSDLYQSLKDPKIQSDMDYCAKGAESFAQTYGGMFVGDFIQAYDLAKAIQIYENLSELLGRLSSFAGLNYYKNLTDSAAQQFYQETSEKITKISTHFIFFTLDINKIPDEPLQKALAESTELKRYEPWIRHIRTFKAHQLSSEAEKLFMEKALTSSSAWNRLYDETLASMKFIIDGQSLTLSHVTEMMSHKDPKVRRQAAMALSDGLNQNLSLLAFITNTLIKDKETEDTWRQYSSPTSERHLANQVEPEVVEALVSAVKSQYPNLSHRYYALKAKMLGQPTLQYWDRNAPLPDVAESKTSWLQARQIVLQAYEQFSPKMAEIGRPFFDNHWIDVPTLDGKTSGAFSHPTVPSVHPYILLNYQGNLRDVTTLAHELGHGIHQVLAAKQGHLLSQTPLTLAETASVFGEMLTFKSLLKQCTDPAQRRQLLASKIEDMLNTVVRQIAFYDFEKRIHTQRRQGELTSETLGDIWIETQREALGDAIVLDPLVRPYWGYISHFIHSPFYVYAYAFGDCLVNSLYAVYEKQPDGFAEKYVDLLSAGGTKHFADLLEPFGLDARHPSFWQQGLTMIASFIDELEAIVSVG
ncbi:MAG: M3 family oligoendopeptidase [Alphaproteobacteria bacterium]|nr:M3 family oligoendopeptidase [Alphaproteobacteria bacterium]